MAVSLFVACKGDKAQTANSAEKVAEATGQTLTVNTDLSTINWTGSKPTGSHTGTIKLSEGTVSVENDKITGGSFTIDMNSINCTDLDGDQKANLEAHLKGSAEGKEDDFFNVAKYPTASFAVTKVTNVANSEEGNVLVYGNLTLKDVTKNVSFTAKSAMSNGMLRLKSNKFKINRTDWGIKFMSNSFFDDLKDNFINDEIELMISVIAK